MRHTAALLAVACLALAGCSSGGEPAGKPSKSVVESPSLSAAEARQACVDAWFEVMRAQGYDPDRGLDDTPSVCEGLPEQAVMYMEALMERNEANREDLDACLDDPACTSWPVG